MVREGEVGIVSGGLIVVYGSAVVGISVLVGGATVDIGMSVVVGGSVVCTSIVVCSSDGVGGAVVTISGTGIVMLKVRTFPP